MERFRWTTEILDRARRIRKNTGAPWRVIAEHLDCDENGLAVALSHRKRGRVKGTREKNGEETKKMILLYLEEDMTLAKIGERYGITAPAVYHRLQRAGIDNEVRKELRREIKM